MAGAAVRTPLHATSQITYDGAMNRRTSTPTTAILQVGNGYPTTYKAGVAGPFGCDPCWDCGQRPAEGARTWQNCYGDLRCDPCAQRWIVRPAPVSA